MIKEQKNLFNGVIDLLNEYNKDFELRKIEEDM